MKTSNFKIMLTAFVLAAVNLTVSSQTPTTAPLPSGQASGALPSARTPYQIFERGPNSRVWQKTEFQVAPDGRQVPQVHKYTELGAGLCRKDDLGHYVDASENIVILPDGTGAATNLASAVYLPADIGADVIRITGSGGVQLRSGPALLDFDDGTNLAVLGVVTNAIGHLISSNQVLYPDIFRGSGFRADLLATARKSGFESCLVFREKIPDPTSLGLGANARLQLLTEFFNPPEPVQTAGTVSQADGLTDTSLRLASVIIGHGKAFVVNATNSGPVGAPQPGEGGATLNPQFSTPVYKTWLHVADPPAPQSRSFLVEQVPYQRLRPQLQTLPAPAASGTAVSHLPSATFASARRPLPPAREIAPGTNQIQIASAGLNQRPGVVLDYVTIDDQTVEENYTLQSGNTYFINGVFYIEGGTLTIQGGAVVKYQHDPSVGVTIEDSSRPVVCQTTAMSPAIFTTMEDDSVGESVPGWPGPVGCGDFLYGCNQYGWALSFANCSPADQPVLEHLRIRYADGGIVSLNGGRIRDCQFLHVGRPLWGVDSCTIQNVLISGANCAIYGTSINATNLTVHNAYQFLSGSMNAINSFFVGVANWGDPFTGAYNTIKSTDAGVFQSGPLGDYYLTSASDCIDVGSTTADRVGLYWFTTQINQAFEGVSMVDRGFHYPAVDANGNPISTLVSGVPDYISDSNGNGLPDAWEYMYFANLEQSATADTDGDGLDNLQEYQAGTDPTKPDTDGDGLSDSEELNIPIDADNPSLGHLDPLNPDTGNTGIPDGQKDSDHDGISNLGELRTYGSDPANAHTFNASRTDSAYLFTAQPLDNTTQTRLGIALLGGGLLKFTVTGGFANGPYDLYCVHNLGNLWRRVYTGVQCDSAGNATFFLQQPNSDHDFFELLSAADADGDGLTDGYEAWFNYSGRHTVIDVKDSDGDLMNDGWEVEYGLNPAPPTGGTGSDGKSGNPDGDAYLNLAEYSNYSYSGGSYDPLKVYATSANRPIVSVLADNATPSCEQSSFTIYRYAGSAADYSQPLTVYYAVGGSLSYDKGDYTLTPTPPDWPRVYSATIPASGQSVTVTLNAPGVSPNPGEVETVNVSLTPYAVSPDPQVPNPNSWIYVVDWQNYDRATITYANQNLRPSANGQNVQTCPAVPKQIALSGSDNCGANLTFSVVTGPSHGSLSAITPINGTSGSVTYTPNGSFCGRDSFTFAANDGLRNSAPATVTVDVGDPNPTANGRGAMTGVNTPVTLVLSGSDSCGEALTFTPVPGFGPYNGTLGTVTQIDPNHASVTYTPHNGFDGVDGFDFSANNCAYESASPAHVTISVAPAPIRPGFDTSTLPANDDSSTGPIGLPFSLDFYGTIYTSLYVNNNANVTFSGSLVQYTPEALVNLGMDIIAPFWADVDTRAPGSAVVTYGTGDVNGFTAFGVNWVNVGYYENHADNQLLSCQLILIDRSDRAPGDYDVEFNYSKVLWEAGDAGGGSQGYWVGPGGEPARAGFASASGSFFEFNGSGSPGAFLDSNTTTGLKYNSFNSGGTQGRYVFQFHNGVPLGTP